MDIDEDRIRLKAYQLWEQRGHPSGSALSDWFEARHLLLTPAQIADTSNETLSQEGLRYGLRQLDSD